MNKVTSGFALGACVPIFCNAAALEKSDQSILAFLESNHYVEASYGELYADVTGQVQRTDTLQQLGIQDYSTGNVVNDYHFANVASKFQIAPQLSFGLIYDQPYGANIDYNYQPETLLGKQQIEVTRLKFESENLSMLVGYQPTAHWNIFAGAVYQQFAGKLDLFGANYSILSGYQVDFKRSSGQGWLAGLSYQRPEYALKTALTYRSKITHKSDAVESINGTTLDFVPFDAIEIVTPQSVNLDLQTGLNSKNILYSAVRWVNWQDFEIQPHQFGTVLDYYAQISPEIVHSFNLIDYKKDQWSAKLGLAHILNDHWVASADVSWDSGSGNPAGTLNPSDGMYALTLGAMYKFNSNIFAAYGVKYFHFNKADVGKLDTNNPITQNSTLSEVGNNSALAHGIKLGYRF